MNAIITQTMHKTVQIDEDVLLKQLGIDPSKHRISNVTIGHGSHFHTGGSAVILSLVEISDADRKRCER